MAKTPSARYRVVSRRAMLKASLGGWILAGTAACGTKDARVFAGAVAEPIPTTTTTTSPPTTTTTTAPSTTTTPPADADTPTSQTPPTEIADQAPDATVETPAPDVVAGGVAVAGEMVIEFTYARSPGGKLESPYVAVWVENESGELLETIALFYQQRRRGARWLDHLDRWFTGDTIRIAAGGADTAATISSATRPPGEYAVTWNGAISGEQAPAGTYRVYIESAREEGPVSLTSTVLSLGGSLESTALPDDGELSSASVRIDG